VADPAKLDRYRDVRVLGTGGMGTVSLADDTTLGRQVALKRVTAAAGERGILRLRREALVGASISHNNLVSIYDVDESEDGELVILMEYVEGETLRDAIARQDGGLGTEETLRILSWAAAGLDAIHDQGIVHRDVKPANVLLGKNGEVKVADLGIAAVSDRTQITTAGAIIGSLRYMAPEQIHEGEATSAIDIYALAAVAYETLSGKRARREPNPIALAYAMENKPPPDLSDVWPEAPAAAAELLKRAMDRDPARRSRSAGELKDRLRSACADSHRPAGPRGRGRDRRRRPHLRGQRFVSPPTSAHAQTKPRARANPSATATSSTASTGASSSPTNSATSSSATTSATKTTAAVAPLSGSPGEPPRPSTRWPPGIISRRPGPWPIPRSSHSSAVIRASRTSSLPIASSPSTACARSTDRLAAPRSP